MLEEADEVISSGDRNRVAKRSTQERHKEEWKKMVWHVEGQKHTNHCVCREKGGEKDYLRESVLWKMQSKPKHQNHSFSFQSFLQNTKTNGFSKEGNTYKPFMKE